MHPYYVSAAVVTLVGLSITTTFQPMNIGFAIYDTTTPTNEKRISDKVRRRLDTVGAPPPMGNWFLLAPFESPSPSPVSLPPSPTPLSFKTLRVNAGGDAVSIAASEDWIGDAFFVGGQVDTVSNVVNSPLNDELNLFKTQRYGTFDYEIPITPGNYHIVLYFMELDGNSTAGSNVFDIFIENSAVFQNIDVFTLSGGALKPLILETPVVCLDGHLSMNFRAVSGKPTVSAYEIQLVGNHLAHAVAGGPYEGVDVDNDGFANISVDGSASHTHRFGRTLVSWEWYENSTIIGRGETATLICSVGKHEIALKVIDDGGDYHVEKTAVVVNAAGYPLVSALSPSAGNISGGNEVILHGHGFYFPQDVITVTIGSINLRSGTHNISVTNDTTIVIHSMPPMSLGVPVSVSVSTPTGESNAMSYTYIDRFALGWKRGTLFNFPAPTCLVFGPDEHLYVGTAEGSLLKLTLNEALDTVIEFAVSNVVATSDPQCTGSLCRTILGLAFDPMDSKENPSVYVSHSQIFHGGSNSSSGKSINGKVSLVSGANLDVIEDVITGLPVSDHDHGINGIMFGDHGELYILCGGNTNAGIEGGLSGSRLQKENVLSAAVLVAHVKRPDFHGFLSYDSADDGNLVGGNGLEIFAYGLRNPYDLVLHSQTGNIYCTDNGPNMGYGKVSVSCEDGVEDIEEEDKLVLLRKDGYYGHPNRKRGERDPRQCLWHSAAEPSDTDYTAPLTILPASVDGILEFESDHWGGQLRGNLIISKYKGGLYRVVLNHEGTSLHPDVGGPSKLVEDGGLDVTQGPSGILYTAKYKGGKIRFLKPIEQPSSSNMAIKSIFPRRGNETGGSILNIYGDNFPEEGAMLVLVGDRICHVISRSSFKIQCRIPGGYGTVDIMVSTGVHSTQFLNGYRFISGKEPTVSPSTQVPSQTNTNNQTPAPSIVVPPMIGNVIRLNCGGAKLIDFKGNVWMADQFYQGGSRRVKTANDIKGTRDSTLYQTARMFRRNRVGPFRYEIPVPSVGNYRVVLGFAEIESSRSQVGKRLSHIVIEGTIKTAGLDIVKASGAPYTRTKFAYGPILVTDGYLTLDFKVVKYNPLVSTIEVHKLDDEVVRMKSLFSY